MTDDFAMLAFKIGTTLLGVECPKCGHRAVFHARDLMAFAPVKEVYELPDLLRRCRCAQCRSKGRAKGVRFDGLGEALRWKQAAG